MHTGCRYSSASSVDDVPNENEDSVAFPRPTAGLRDLANPRGMARDADLGIEFALYLTMMADP